MLHRLGMIWSMAGNETLSARNGAALDEWYTQLHRDLRRMKACWEEGYWDFNLDHACTEFGSCVFRSICMSEPARVR